MEIENTAKQVIAKGEHQSLRINFQCVQFVELLNPVAVQPKLNKTFLMAKMLPLSFSLHVFGG